MTAIEVSDQELSILIKALAKHAKRKQKNVERWTRLKEEGLIVPVEVADHFILIDGKAVDIICPLIERLEYANTAIAS